MQPGASTRGGQQREATAGEVPWVCAPCPGGLAQPHSPRGSARARLLLTLAQHVTRCSLNHAPSSLLPFPSLAH